MGPIDLLVNNAGMTSVTDEESWLSITDMTPEQWRQRDHAQPRHGLPRHPGSDAWHDSREASAAS